MIAGVVGEGSSDRALLPILRWIWEQATPDEVQLSWVDTRRFQRTPDLADKIRVALKVYPCDVLFVHRDSDKQPPDWRRREIQDAVGEHPYIAVVPVRMTEAWLLFDEGAIRAAAGRVSGKNPLEIPSLSHHEALANPKKVLHDALIQANGATGRRARRFRPAAAAQRLAVLIEDWEPLRRLSAFQRLEADTRQALQRLGSTLYSR